MQFSASWKSKSTASNVIDSSTICHQTDKPPNHIWKRNPCGCIGTHWTSCLQCKERKEKKLKRNLWWGRGGERRKVTMKSRLCYKWMNGTKKRSTKGWSQLAINTPAQKEKSCQKWHPNLNRQIRLDSDESSFRVKMIFSRLQTSCIMRKLIFVYSSTKRKWWNLFLSPPFWKLYIAMLVSLRKTCVLEEDAHGINPGCTLVTPRLSWIMRLSIHEKHDSVVDEYPIQ